MINQGKFFCHFNLIIWKLLTFQISTKILNTVGSVCCSQEGSSEPAQTRENCKVETLKDVKLVWAFGGSNVPLTNRQIDFL